MARVVLALLGMASLLISGSARAAEPASFEFRDGDRIVLIGDALIERDQEYGYLETLLTLQNPDKNLTFRNLGWSGDTVHGDARARFGTPADGFAHLKEHVLALKPTVLIVGYGMTDSFDGEAGLPRFVEGLDKLFAVFAETKARLIVLPIRGHENLGKPLPDPTAHNKVISLYNRALDEVARRQGAWIGLGHDRREGDGAGRPNLTDDGIHLTPFGYWTFAQEFDKSLGLRPPARWFILTYLSKDGQPSPHDIEVSSLESRDDGLRIEARAATLPLPPWPREGAPLPSANLPDPYFWGMIQAQSRMRPGRYLLKIDGKERARADDKTWRLPGVKLTSSPELDQVEALRKTINEKNRLYFHRWRPQNETYLFGFRKHEQGNNAREIPLFDPLVEAKEKEIARLRKPVSHVYEIVREGDGAR